MKIEKQLKMLAATWMLVLVAACTTLGLAPAQSPSEGLAYAYGAVAAARSTAAQELQSGQITTATAQKVLALTDQARGELDAGQQVLTAGGATTTVMQDLQLATALLTQVQAMLPKPTTAVVK